MNQGNIKFEIQKADMLEEQIERAESELYENLSREVETIKVTNRLTEALLQELKNIRLRLHFGDKSPEELREAQNSFVSTVKRILGFEGVFMVVSLMDISHKVYIPPSCPPHMSQNTANNGQALSLDISQVNTIIDYKSAASIDELKPKLATISQYCPVDSRTYCLKVREDIGRDYSDLYLFCSYKPGNKFHSLIIEYWPSNPQGTVHPKLHS
jgi:hypothetical protein